MSVELRSSRAVDAFDEAMGASAKSGSGSSLTGGKFFFFKSAAEMRWSAKFAAACASASACDSGGSANAWRSPALAALANLRSASST